MDSMFACSPTPAVLAKDKSLAGLRCLQQRLALELRLRVAALFKWPCADWASSHTK
jgi:hypothetical protein